MLARPWRVRRSQARPRVVRYTRRRGGYPLCQGPSVLDKASPLPTDPLTPESAKRSLRAVTESESNPLCSQEAAPTAHRGGVCATEGV